MRRSTTSTWRDAVKSFLVSSRASAASRGITVSFRASAASRGIAGLLVERPLFQDTSDSSTTRLRRSARNDHGSALLTIALLLFTTACDRGVDLVRDRLARGSRATIDSLSAQNATLQRQMVVFERISAEKDTLLREVREAHLLIEAIAQELQRIDGPPAYSDYPAEVEHATAADVAAVASSGEVAVDPLGEIPGGTSNYREAMLRRLEGVRH